MRKTMKKLTQGATRLLVLALGLGLATTGWAVVPTPTAVWDGNFSTTKVNGWTLDANGNTVASDKSTITITSKGFTITPATAVTAGTGVSVLVKMSGVSQNADNDQILVCAKQNGVGVMVGTSLCAGAMTMHGAWNGAAKWSDSQNAETTFSVPSSGEYYIAFTTGDGSTTVREGVYVGGTMNLKEISGLRASSYTVQQITIGGRPASESEKASNAVISRVMIYTGCLTQQQMKDAIDDMETTKSYSLQCQASGNKGGLAWANFQLPYSTHYVESGSASLNTDKALRQITIPWRPDSTVNGTGATSLYLGITDSSGKLLALSSGADMSTVTTTSSSTFDFSQAYLSAGTQYRYWFLNSDSYSLGDTITGGIQMGCALYSIGSNDAAMWTDTMGQGNPYCPAARFWCSNMTGSEFTATAGGTAVSTSGAYADDITLKGVADGKFTLGGALNAARITLADAAATIEMDSGDSIKAQYLDNSSQKLVIDASNGATAFGTYTLFEGNLASVADANLEVTFPSLGSGYELYTTKTANKISYQVDRTAVNATLTLTADCNFSEVKDSIDWIDSNHSTLEIVNNQESPITLTFDENITAGSITVSGTGTTIIESSNSAVITAGTVTIPSGSTIDATGSAITTCTGSGTFVWKAGYPTTVPAGVTYRYVGSNDSANPVAIAGGVTVTGTLKTSGYTSLASLVIDAAGTLDILSESTSVITTYRSNGAGNLSGKIVIESGATLVNGGTDALDWAGSPTVDVYGTLAMGTTRWSVSPGCTFNLRAGAQVTGTGDSLASLDFINGVSKGLDVYGSARVEGKVRVRANETRIWIAENSTLVLANGIADGGGHTGGFKQVGPGTLEIHANSTGLSGNASIMTQGALRLADTTLAFPVELQGNSSYLEVVATEAATVVPVNIASIANNNVTFSGAGKVNGTITKTSAPGGNLATALQSSAWTGTFVADWAGANGTRFDINSYGNANSVVEVTKLAGGYVSGSNADVTVVPTVKVSGTMTLDNGYSGKVTTFTKLTGSGTVTFNTYTCDITALDNFTGTLTPTDSYGTTIGTINLTSAPAFGAKVVTLGNGANIRSIANTKVSVNGVVDESLTGRLEVKSDGIYVKSTVAITVPSVANTTVAVTAGGEPVEGLNGVYTVPYGSAVVVTYAAAEGYELSGTSEYTIASATADETIDASGTTVAQYQAAVLGSTGTVINYYATAQAAVAAVAADYTLAGQYDHFEVYNGTDVAITVPTSPVWSQLYVKVKCLNGATVVVSASSADENYSAGEPDENSIVTYTKIAVATTYVWTGATSAEAETNAKNWGRPNNWKIGSASGAAASRAPSSIDTAVLESGAYANIASAATVAAVRIDGAVTLTGVSMTLTATTGGIVLTDAAASITVSGVTLSPTPTTTVANSYVKLTDSTYSVQAFVTVTIPDVANASATVNGDAVAGGASVQVDAGSNVTIAWTAASGYKITAGATQTINSIAANTTADTPTVEIKGATVSNVNFAYGADYATATVTATVSGDATSATLSYGNTTYNTNVVNGTVTFENVAVTRGSDIYAATSYTVTTDAGETTGGSGTTVAADVVAAGWINENAETSGTSAGGSWTNAVTYANGKAEISDNRFEAATPSTASRVVLEFNVCFSSTSDEDVSGEAQAAIKLAEVDSVTTFMVLTNGNNWAAVSAAGLEPDASATYKVVLTIDYGSNAYGVTVGNYVLTNSAGSASFPLAASRTSVQTIDFAGSGTLRSLKGDQVEGYMVVDNNGTRYPSIAAAIEAYSADPTIAPLRVLHDGTAPFGWKIVTEGGVDILKKVAKGLFFMAY